MALEVEAALGRIGWAIRVLVMGLRIEREDCALIARCLLREASNLCLLAHANQPAPAREELADLIEEVWSDAIDRVPTMSRQLKGEGN